jgi:3-hydroxybutyryl-CoA dehydrogenase
VDVQRIGIVGAGAMGTGIAMVAALAGKRVLLNDVAPGAWDRARGEMGRQWARQVERGRIGAEEVEAARGRIEFASELDGMSGVDWVVEAVVEKPDVKQAVLRELDRLCRPEVVLATNTSSISITLLAAATARPAQVVGMHFFNPATVMNLIEVTRGYLTSDATVEATLDLARAFGKTPVLVRKDSPGFIVNRLLFAQFAEAVRMLEEGVASAEDIDTALRLGLNHPMGPFTLQDFTGVDTCLDVMTYLYTALHREHFAPPLTMELLVRAGWFDYR